MQDLNCIKVFTSDLIELAKCHNSRARQLIKKKEATIFLFNGEKCLQLNKNHNEILKEKGIL